MSLELDFAISPKDVTVVYYKCNRCDWESERSATKIPDVEYCPNCSAEGEEIKLSEVPVKCPDCGFVRCKCDPRDEMEFL